MGDERKEKKIESVVGVYSTELNVYHNLFSAGPVQIYGAIRLCIL